jgi:hypothetical protein
VDVPIKLSMYLCIFIVSLWLVVQRKQAEAKSPQSEWISLGACVVPHVELVDHMLSFNNIFLIVIVNEPIEGSDTSFEERNLIFSRMKANL